MKFAAYLVLVVCSFFREVAVVAQPLAQPASGTRSAGEAMPGPEGSAAARFNYVIGTQTFSPNYQFTKKSPLVETAEAIRDMGATVIKFELSERYPRRYRLATAPEIHSLTELARDEPSYRQVMDMPFAYYVIWAHTFSGGGDASWRNGFSRAWQTNEYREMYDLTRYLLKTYNGSGKTFYLGHWEGDGWLRGNVNPENDARVTPEAVQGMIDWLNTRQRAIDAAKRDTPHAGVQVWHYTEVNHVKIAMQGRKALVNTVLPRTGVDFVSYSSYDTAGDPKELKAALDFIESKLPAKPGIPGKRVFIGEYGFPSLHFGAARQNELSRHVMRAGLEWGCPFILYWEMYNNEVDPEGKQRGFWLIDDHGVKQPVYETHRWFYEWGRRYVAEFAQRAQHPPSAEEFRAAAIAFLAGVYGEK